ncbi:MAG: AraC family transcriptional regulator, partial [Cyanobacteria bacterium P01_D01_bin.56]
LDHTRAIDQIEHDEICQRAEESSEGGYWQQIDTIERRASVPQQLGQGEERLITLKPGLEIHIENFTYQRSLHLDSQRCLDAQTDSANRLSLSFYLAGGTRTINPGIQLEEDREETAGQACIAYLKGVRSIEYVPAERPTEIISIAIDLERLQLFGLLEETVSPLLQPLQQGNSLERFHQTLNPITPALQQILKQVLDCPYQGAFKRMYLESKVLELLSLQFYQLSAGQYLSTPKLCSADVERLRLARDILQQRFDQPPSLLELARQIGLNDHKLKQGFRQLFDTTVFGYVQTCRMEQAQQLLSEGELSIANVAERVGYASPSRFCHAFKRNTGITPSKYRRQFKV